MKICLVLDQSNLGPFYVYTLMRDYLSSKNIQLDIFLNPNKTTLGISEEGLRGSTYHESILSHVTFGLPSPAKYDTLLISNLKNKDQTCISRALIESFTDVNKLVLCIKSSSCLSTHSWSQHLNTSAPILYGLPRQNLGGFTICVGDLEKTIAPKHIFHMHHLEVYKYKKPFHLNKEEFYNKYNLNPDLKILSFFPGGMHGHPTYAIEHQLHHKAEELNTVLGPLGYQLVCKLHFNEYFGRKSHFHQGQLSSNVYFENIPTIAAEDAYELIKYSSFSLTSSTTMAFEHYLYNLPTINIGLKDEGSQEYKTFLWLCPPSGNFDFRDLIFGDIYESSDFFSHPEKCFDSSFSREHHINSFTFKDNHSVFGDAYDETIESACDNLLNIIKKNS